MENIKKQGDHIYATDPMKKCIIVVHTYIHTFVISDYNSLVRITTRVLTLPILCLLILYSLKSTPNHIFLRKFFMSILFYS